MDQTSLSEIESQQKLLETIQELLLSAGYYRAIIHGLSPFDRVVGGLCWCIISSGEIVDVDILFQENSRVGEKIAFSEAIVDALKLLQCPHDLQPHQIQGGVGGSDFKYILPVLQWLIQKFFQRRDIIKYQLRYYSTLYCIKNCNILENNTNNNNKSGNNSSLLESILLSRKVKRNYKRQCDENESEETRVHSCLLEYSDNTENNSSMIKINVDNSSSSEIALNSLSNMNSSELNSFERRLQQASKDSAAEEAAYNTRNKEEEEELMRQMKASACGNVISASVTGDLVGLGASEIGSAAAAYEAELDNARNLLGSTGSRSAMHKQQVDQFQNKINDLKSLVEIQKNKTDQLINESNIKQDFKNDNKNKIKLLENNLNELIILEESHSIDKQRSLKALKTAIMNNEKLKIQENNFKSQCKIDKTNMLEELSALEDQNQSSSEGKLLKQVQESYKKGYTKYERIKKVLADTNLSVSAHRRSIDDIPTRSELIQYERRFGELYAQTAQRLAETRKYYTLYNNLDTTLGFLKKEVRLLNSISDNFDVAMTDVYTKEEYLNQCSEIVKGAESTLIQQKQIKDDCEIEGNSLKSKLNALVNEQRAYYKAIKDFQIECDKNEWLEAKINSIQINTN